MGIEKLVKDSLRGQPFVGTTVRYKYPVMSTERICGLCFYRYGHDKDDLFPWIENPGIKPDCGIIPHNGAKDPHELFGFGKEEYLPERIEGKEVGNHCPYFLHFTAK
jgi:hypothetical protein